MYSYVPGVAAPAAAAGPAAAGVEGPAPPALGGRFFFGRGGAPGWYFGLV